MAWTGEVAICNGALGMLGASFITSLAGTSTNEVLCNHYYAQCRDSTLRAYPWNFAVRRANLGAALASTDANAPEWGFVYGYTLPTNPKCLRVLEMEDREAFRVEGRVLYTDVTSPKIRYIAQITSPEAFDDLFKSALSAKLAMHLAMPITKSKSMLESMAALYANLLDEAQHADTQEGTADEIDSDELLDVRNGTIVSRSQYLAR